VGPVVASLDERRLLRALRAGDEGAYAELHERYDARLLALAMATGCSRAVAQEAVQETWAAVVRTIDSFEGRSALKTWIFRILVNTAGAHARRERRSVPLSGVPADFVELDAARRPSALEPDEHVIWKETVVELHAAIAGLSPAQRSVITLRDVHGWSPQDVRAHLGLSEGNERVLLHRARTHVRRRLADYLAPAAPTTDQANLKEAA
jgi:RNA polymerase sigma-70 factor (ECF subfamily)